MISFRLGLGLAAVGAVFLVSGIGCTRKNAQDTSNTFHYVCQQKIKGFDPAFADDTYTGYEVGRVYEGLLQYHYLKRPYTLIPNLAESLPEISSDGKILTFHLKKGVLFQDDPAFEKMGGKGRELTAEDVVYSLKRLADPKLASTCWWVLDGKVVGLNAWREEASKAEQTDYAVEVEGLKALDRYTFQLTLTQKFPTILYVFAMPHTSIVAKEVVDHYGPDFLNHPVGTGPFRLESYSSGSKWVWVKNPTFRTELYPSEGEPGDAEAGLLADAGKPLPRVDRIVEQVMIERQPVWLHFLDGKVDLSTIPKDSFEQAMTPSQELTPELKAKNLSLAKTAVVDVTYEAFNMADPLIGRNKLLRQALSLAVNPQPLNQLFFNGTALPAQGPIPPGVQGYDPAMKNPYRQYNVQKAKEFLAKAGYPEGKGLPTLEYITESSTASRQIAEYLEKSFSAIGVKLRVSTYSFPELRTAIRNGKGQIFGVMAWNADYPDAENFLQLFYSKNHPPGTNSSRYSNPAFDRLYEQAIKLPDGAERTKLYKQMALLVVEDAPWIFQVHRVAYDVLQPWLKNYRRNIFEHTRAKYYRIDSTLKR